MNDDDRITDPDGRSPYECILCELNEIKALLHTNGAATLGSRVRRLETLAWMPVVAALVLAACTLVR